MTKEEAKNIVNKLFADLTANDTIIVVNNPTPTSYPDVDKMSSDIVERWAQIIMENS